MNGLIKELRPEEGRLKGSSRIEPPNHPHQVLHAEEQWQVQASHSDPLPGMGLLKARRAIPWQQQTLEQFRSTL